MSFKLNHKINLESKIKMSFNNTILEYDGTLLNFEEGYDFLDNHVSWLLVVLLISTINVVM